MAEAKATTAEADAAKNGRFLEAALRMPSASASRPPMAQPGCLLGEGQPTPQGFTDKQSGDNLLYLLAPNGIILIMIPAIYKIL